MTPPPFPEFSAWMRPTYGVDDKSDHRPLLKPSPTRKSELESSEAGFSLEDSLPRPPLLQFKTWDVGLREPLSNGQSNSRNRHTSFSIPPILPEPDDADTAHAKRRLSLIAELPDLASSCQDVYSEINDIFKAINTIAFQETREFWLSMSIRYSRASLEATSLKAAVRNLDIHRLSSFWARAWKALYEQRQSICMTRELLHEVHADHDLRMYGAGHPQDLIDGFQVQFFRDKVRTVADRCAGAVNRIRDVNCFALGEHKRPIRQAQWVNCEQLSGTLERMAMRRLVPPSLERKFERP